MVAELVPWRTSPWFETRNRKVGVFRRMLSASHTSSNSRSREERTRASSVLAALEAGSARSGRERTPPVPAGYGPVLRGRNPAYRNLLKSCPVCLIACKPSGKGFLEVVPFKPLHGDSPHPTYRPKDLDVLCMAAFRWGLCCGGWRTKRSSGVSCLRSDGVSLPLFAAATPCQYSGM